MEGGGDMRFFFHWSPQSIPPCPPPENGNIPWRTKKIFWYWRFDRPKVPSPPPPLTWNLVIQNFEFRFDHPPHTHTHPNVSDEDSNTTQGTQKFSDMYSPFPLPTKWHIYRLNPKLEINTWWIHYVYSIILIWGTNRSSAIQSGLSPFTKWRVPSYEYVKSGAFGCLTPCGYFSRCSYS